MTADGVIAAACGTRYTAALLRIERDGAPVFERAYGSLDGSPHAPATEVTTPFDVASLTKIFVACATLRAVERGALALDAPLGDLVPEWRGSTARATTVRDLLAHVSGMASGADYRTLFDENVERFALVRERVARSRERVIYSDLGFIALGVVLARAEDRALAGTIAATARALGCEATGYRARPDDASSVPATEWVPWRGRIRGSVHDEKAFLMGGVAGHAGLFATARDVARLAEAFLAPFHGRASGVLGAALAIEAVAEQAPDAVLRRGLGWALKTSDDNSCGTAMSRETFGHTGFTGTMVWADPVRDLSVTLLTNAVYVERGDLRDVRAAACDAAVAEFG